ncbi:hypothetical protein ES703_04579 [subsurface metagenome]
MARYALKLLSNVKQSLVDRIGLDGLGKFLLGVACLTKTCVKGDELCQPVDLTEWDVKRPSNVANRGLGLHGVEGYDACDVLLAVALVDV